MFHHIYSCAQLIFINNSSFSNTIENTEGNETDDDDGEHLTWNEAVQPVHESGIPM